MTKDLADRIAELAARVPDLKVHLPTEQATKNALVLPFLRALGYDPFDPKEIMPEFTADVGTKKGEKVDYAVMREGQPIMLVECKCCGTPLDASQCGQLLRYFHVTPARIGILTDGIRYHFYTDLDQQNVMDQKPFMSFDLGKIDEGLVPELKKVSKASWDLQATINAAAELKYTSQLRREIAQEMQDPSDALVRLLAGKVYQGNLTAAVKEQFRDLTRRAFRQVVNETIDERLKSAMSASYVAPQAVPAPTEDASTDPGKVVTTQDEIDAFLVVKAILREVVAVDRIIMRDTQSYCGILLDDNNRKPLCRFRFGPTKKTVGIIVNGEKAEDRVAIESIDDIYGLADRLKAAAKLYESSSS